jgi:hypothetical protein
MTSSRERAGGIRRRVLGVVVLAALLTGGPASAQELAEQAKSLQWIPADATTYSVMLRNREQWQAVTKSVAWARLNALPVVKKGWDLLHEEWAKEDGPLAHVRQWYQDDANKALVKLLGDLVADEVFIYGGGNAPEFLALLQELQAVSQFAPFLSMLEGKNPAQASRPEERVRLLLKTLADHPEKIVVPEIVFGFRLKDAGPARAQLKRLGDLAKHLAAMEPKLKKHLQKTTVAGADFWTLKLDGTMIPWDQLPLGNLEENPGEFDKLIKRLKELKLTVSLGVREPFALLAIGQSPAFVGTLGKGKLLKDRPEFERLSKFADKKIVALGYGSKEWQALQNVRHVDVEDMAKGIMEQLKNLNITAEQEARIRKDLAKLAKDLKSYLPEPGPTVSISFLTDTGYESIAYDWTKNLSLDGSKALTLLNHAGGTPLLVVAGRVKVDPKDYAMMVKWIKVAHHHFEEIVLPQLGVKQIYDPIFKLIQPSLERLDKTTGEMLLPALADGQWAFVLDAKLKSKQWHRDMPPSDKALPLPEPALVIGVKDADLLRKAFEEYRQTINGLLASVGQLVPGLPEITLPPAQSKKVKGGTLYYYPIPDVAGLDTQIGPAAGLSKHVATLAISSDHAGRLLTAQPLQTSSPLLADPKKHLASAAHVNLEGLIRALGPWVEYGLEHAGLAQQGEGAENVLAQARSAIDILTVFRSFTSISYLEKGVLVTRSQSVIRDLSR